MTELTEEEGRMLLNAAKKSHAHKLLQIKGYGKIVKRSIDVRGLIER